MYFRFLAAKKLFTKSSSEFKKLLKEFWFTLYSRGNRILGSRLVKKENWIKFLMRKTKFLKKPCSGFEHVFLGEKKLGKVQVRPNKKMSTKKIQQKVPIKSPGENFIIFVKE